MQHWYQTSCYDRRAARLYDRHYSRAILNKASIGKNQITIANAIVLVTANYDALWITRWQNPVARNDGKDMWCNQVFRNEGDVPSSELITEAVQISRWRWWPMIPPDGFITYIADTLITSEIPGYCYMRAKPRWHKRGITSAKKLTILGLSPEQLMKVEPLEPKSDQTKMVFESA